MYDKDRIVEILKKEYLKEIVKEITKPFGALREEQNGKIGVYAGSGTENAVLADVINTLANDLAEAYADLTLQTEFGKNSP